MLVHPDVARLRKALPAQPLTDAALAAWRARADVTAVQAALARHDAGAGLAELPELARPLDEAEAARALVEGFVTPLTAALRAEPLAQLPLGHSATPGMARLRLASHGRTALTLAAYAPRARAVPVSALFDDGAAHEIIVAGAGSALIHRLERGKLSSAEITLTPGTRLTRRSADDARQIIAVTQPLLVLQLTREAAAPAPSREVALADGRVMTTISGCKRTSQQVMALGVLGALGHAPAVPAMAEVARDQSAARDLRWEALRQCLAMDTAQGLAVLAALAGDADDPLHTPAAALQQQLLASRPELAALIGEPA